jgi:phosphonate transport system substrate-binding protein
MARSFWKPLLLLAACLFLAAAPLPKAQAQGHNPAKPSPEAPLRLGIVPYTTPQSLLRIYRAYRLFLQGQLGRNVLILTAPTHKDFLQDAKAGRFDIVITTAHLVPDMLANGMDPLLRYTSSMRLCFVSRSGNPLKSPRDLAGKRIALPGHYSLFGIVGLRYLKDLEAKDGIHVAISYEPSHTAALMSVAKGMHDAAATALHPLRQLPPELRAQLIASAFDGGEMPPMMTLANKRLGPAMEEKIKEALLAFEKSPEGFNFFQSTGYVGYAPVSPEDIAKLKPYSDLLDTVLKEGKP